MWSNKERVRQGKPYSMVQNRGLILGKWTSNNILEVTKGDLSCFVVCKLQASK